MLLQWWMLKPHWYKQKGFLEVQLNPFLELTDFTCKKKSVYMQHISNLQCIMSSPQTAGDVRKNNAIFELEGRCDCLPSLALANTNKVHPPAFWIIGIAQGQFLEALNFHFCFCALCNSHFIPLTETMELKKIVPNIFACLKDVSAKLVLLHNDDVCSLEQRRILFHREKN